MSWLTLALGLIREAATTETGQDILNNMRHGGSGRQPNPSDGAAGAAGAADAPTEAWRESVEKRLGAAGRNTELLVRMLNAQDESMVRIQKRQRIWNLCLAGAIVLTAAACLWIWLS